MPIPKYYVRPDGLHETIIRINGKRKAFRGKTDREVWNKVKAYREERESGMTETFKAVADAWWDEIEPALEENTKKSYRPAYKRAVAHFGAEDVSEITTEMIEIYIRSFAKTYAKKTVITQRQIIHQILTKAVRNGDIKYNPAEAVPLPKKLPQKKRRAPSPEQIKKIKDSVGDEFGLFAFLIYYTGLRRGEVEGLRYEDIDREAKRIHVSRSVYNVSTTSYTKDTKTEAGARSLPLLDALAEALPNKKRGYIFSDDGGKTPTPDWKIQRRYEAYQARTGVSVTPHEIRHGYATALHEAGIDYKTAQEFLGHAQLSTTMDIYTDVLDKSITEAAKKMDESF